jgi:hypothetical protein
MPEAGGTANQSGILFQNSIAALFIGDMLDAAGKSPIHVVVAVRIEAPTDVDDTVVTYADGHRAFIQAKENIDPRSDAWRNLWRDFEAQFNRTDFKRQHDRLILYAGGVTEELRQLREICRRAEGALNLDEWNRSLNDAQKKLLYDNIRLRLSFGHRGPVPLLEFFRHLEVMICPVEDIEQHEAPRWMPQCSAPAATLFDLLLAQTGRHARYRKTFVPDPLRQLLQQQHNIQFHALPSVTDMHQALKACSAILRGQRNTIGHRGPHLARAITAEIVAWAKTPQEDNLAVLVDGPGKGKTVVMRDVLEVLETEGIPTLAIKADRQLEGLVPGQQPHEYLNLPDSVERIAARLALNGPVAILIDQVDALSLSLARDQTTLNTVLGLVLRLRGMKNVSVLLSCRTFDLNSDPALKNLDIKHPFSLSDFTDEEIERGLSGVNVDTALLSPVTRELLRVPLHLDLLALAVENQELTPEAVRAAGGLRTLQDLYTLIWNEIISASLPGAPEVADRVLVLRLLTERMNREQKASAPRSLFHTPDTRRLHPAVDYLASAGILSGSLHEWGFLHQTFFDYCYARFFVEDGRRLADEVLSGPQGLFERPQVLQVLAYLRGTAPIVYTRELHSLLGSARLRTHLRDLLQHWFGALPSPDEYEWRIARGMIFDSARRALFFRLADGNPTWLRWLEGETLDALLESDDEVIEQEVLPYLQSVSHDANAQVAIIRIVRPFLNKSEAWNRRLAWLMSLLKHWHVEEAVALYEELLHLRLQGQLESSKHLFNRLPDIAKGFPETACRLLKDVLLAVLEHYRHRIAVAMEAEQSTLADDGTDADPLQEIERLHRQMVNRDPFEEIDEQSARYVLEETVKEVTRSTPISFLQAMLPVVEEAVRLTPPINQRRFGFPRDPLNHGFKHFVGGHVIRNANAIISDSLADAIGRAVTENREVLHAAMTRLTALPYETPQCLVADAYAALAESHAVEALNWLLDDEQRFYLGEPEQLISRRLIAAIHPHLDDDGRNTFEEAILRFDITRHWEKDRDVLRWRGHEQLRLLQALQRDRLQPATRRQLEELERKFPGYMASSEPLTGGTAFVGSPIETAGAEKLLDDDWLSAMTHYSDGDRHITGVRDGGLYLSGGAHELAEYSLKPQVEKEPERFARLALDRVPADVDQSYVRAFLSGLAESDERPALLFDVVRRFADHPGREIKRSIASALEKRIADGLPDDLLDLLEQWVRAPMGADEGFYTAQRGEDSGSKDDTEEHAVTTLNTGPFMDYLNSDRGSAFRTLMEALRMRKDDRAKERRWQLIEFVAADPSDALRSGAIEQLITIMDDNRERAISTFENLVRDRPHLLPIYFCERFIWYGIFRFYERVKPFIELLRHAPSGNAAQIGARLAAVAALHGHDEGVVEELLTGRVAWRRGLAQVWAEAAFAPDLEAGQCARCRQDLRQLLEDEDEWIQRYIAGIFHNLRVEDWDEDASFIEAILSSHTYSEALDTAAKWVWKNGLLRPERALRLVEIFVNSEHRSRREFRGYGGEPLVRLTLQIYNDPFSDDTRKESAIELFGRLLERFPGDARRALNEWDQDRFKFS